MSLCALMLSQPPHLASLSCVAWRSPGPRWDAQGTVGLLQVASLPSQAGLVSPTVYTEGLATISTSVRFFATIQTLDFLCFASPRNSSATVNKLSLCACRLPVQLFSSSCLNKESETWYRNGSKMSTVTFRTILLVITVFTAR